MFDFVDCWWEDVAVTGTGVLSVAVKRILSIPEQATDSVGDVAFHFPHLVNKIVSKHVTHLATLIL